MPKKYREVREALREAGWAVLRRRGSRDVWARPGESVRVVVAGKSVSEYIVIYEQAEDGGWGAYLPDLPGVVARRLSRGG